MTFDVVEVGEPLFWRMCRGLKDGRLVDGWNGPEPLAVTGAWVDEVKHEVSRSVVVTRCFEMRWTGTGEVEVKGEAEYKSGCRSPEMLLSRRAFHPKIAVQLDSFSRLIPTAHFCSSARRPASSHLVFLISPSAFKMVRFSVLFATMCKSAVLGG